MKKILTIGIICAMLWIGCGGDKEPPEVSIANPANGTVVSDTVNVTAEASDNKGVEKVEFYIDSALASTSTAEPYSYSWVTTGLQDSSSHTVYAKAYDAAENEGVSQTVSVIVYNGGGQGTLKWAFSTGSGVISSPAIGSDGTIYVGSYDDRLYAIYGSGSLASTPWPMFHHDLKHTGKVGGGF